MKRDARNMKRIPDFPESTGQIKRAQAHSLHFSQTAGLIKHPESQQRKSMPGGNHVSRSAIGEISMVSARWKRYFINELLYDSE